MIGGFAAIAWPAHYGETGMMTFIVNQDGDIYEQRSRARDGDQLAPAITAFDPEKGWEKADMTPP